MFVGADAYIGPYNMLCMDISWLGIPEMSRNGIDAVCPQLRVVHSSEAKAIGPVAILRPKRASNKIARVSAQYGASPSASFCLLFLAQQKK